jgi:hypothetical protein
VLNQVGCGQLEGGKEADGILNEVTVLLKAAPQKGERIPLYGPDLGEGDVDAGSHRREA